MKYPSIKLSMLQRQLISLTFSALLFTVPIFAAEQWTEPVTRMKFVSVPGGSFRIGDQFDEGSNDEQNNRKITIQPFHLGATGGDAGSVESRHEQQPLKVQG